MSQDSAIRAIMNLMEGGPGPMSNMGVPSIGDDGSMAMGMMISSNDEFADEECCDQGFHPDDYRIARELLDRVGSAERARELIDNLDEVYETLDLSTNTANNIDIIAGHIPDEPDFPNNRFSDDGGF